MWEWIKNLEPEFLIIFIGMIVIVLMNAGIWVKVRKTLNLIGKRALTIKEDLVIRDEKKVVDILISNTTFISVRVAAIGYIYRKNLLPLSEETMEISPRDSQKISIEVDALRAYLIDDKLKVKRMKIYVEDTLGRRSIHKAKDTYRILKKMVKEEKRQIKLAAKKKRFETGKYNFMERVGLVLKFIFSPISKMNEALKNGVNKRLKERESRLIINKKEKEHKRFLKSIAEEDRREKELADVEERIKKERSEVEKMRREKEEKDNQKKSKMDRELSKIEKEKNEIKAQTAQEKVQEDQEKIRENDDKIELEEAEKSENNTEDGAKNEEKKAPKKTSKTKKDV